MPRWPNCLSTCRRDLGGFEVGRLTDEVTQEVLRSYMTEMHGLIVRVLTVLPRGA